MRDHRAGQETERVGTCRVFPNRLNVLSGILVIEAAVPVRVSVKAENKPHTVSVPASTNFSTRHEIPLVGMRPESRYTLEVSAVDGAGRSCAIEGDRYFSTGRVPDDFPIIEFSRSGPPDDQGITLFNLMPWHVPTADSPTRPFDLNDQDMLGYLVAVDSSGSVVWYYRANLEIEDAKQLPNGDILMSYGDTMARQINVLGQTVREWASRIATDVMPNDDLGRPVASPEAIPIATDTMHHEITLLPNGDLFFLSTELRQLTDPERRWCGGGSLYNIISDIIVQADAESGAIRHQWPLLDVLDPFTRPGSHLCHGGLPVAPPLLFHQDAHFPRDWSHGNAVIVDAARNTMVLSLRHVDSVLGLRYMDDEYGPANEILWDFGIHGNVELAAGQFPYHQHAVELNANGELLLYDNGVGRSEVDSDKVYSRAVAYQLEYSGARVHRARQVWEHSLLRDGVPVFSRRMGDADQLDNGNVLITHGNVSGPDGSLNARVIEVTRGDHDGGAPVFDLTVFDDDPLKGWTIYRAARIDSFYPGRDHLSA